MGLTELHTAPKSPLQTALDYVKDIIFVVVVSFSFRFYTRLRYEHSYNTDFRYQRPPNRIAATAFSARHIQFNIKLKPNMLL